MLNIGKLYLEFRNNSINDSQKLEKLSNICKNNRFYLSSTKTKMVKLIENVKNNIDNNLQKAINDNRTNPTNNNKVKIQQLTAKALELAEITHQFRDRCRWGEGVAKAEEEEVNLWAFKIGIREKMTEQLRAETEKYEAELHETETPNKNETELPNQNFRNPVDASSIFDLTNLGALFTDDPQLIKSSSLTLPFVVNTLESLLKNNEIPKNEINEVTRLLNSYKSAHRIIITKDDALKEASRANTQQAYIPAKQTTVQTIIKELETNDEITVATGYVARPSGHAIGLRLKATTGEDGKRYVQGTIINRGEGVNYHGGEIQQGTTERVIPFLDLGVVSLDALASSRFLGLLVELGVTDLPTDNAQTLGDSTRYTIEDFYEVVLPEWPRDEFPAQVQEQMVRKAQDGNVCSMKEWMTPMRECLSPELARYIKLKMRIDSLELYLHHGELNEASIPLLEWSIKKINRTLKKLEAQPSLQGGYPSWLKSQLEKQNQYCAELTDSANKKIQQLKEKALAESSFKIDYDPDIPALEMGESNLRASKAIFPIINLIPSQIAPASSPKKNLAPPPLHFKSAEEAVAYIYELDKYRISKKKSEVFQQRILQCLEALPSSSDMEFWTSPLLITKKDRICPITLLTLFLVLSNSYRIPDGKPQQITGREVTEIANVSAGILIALKQSKEFDDDYVEDRASRLLGVIETASPQIRTESPALDRRLKDSILKFQELSRGKKLPLTFKKHTYEGGDWISYTMEQIPCATTEERLKDAVLRNFIKKKPIGMSDEEVVVRSRAYYDWDLEGDMLKCHEHLIHAVGISATAHTNLLPRIEREFTYDGGREINCIVVRLSNISPHREDLQLSTFGVLADELYPWNDDERLIAQEFLDRRIPFRGGARDTQNEQLKASRKAVRFGGDILQPDEIERFLSITTSPDTLIPQCIHCFSLENSFGRLKDPRFQALLHGFLLAKTSDGSNPVLSESLKNPLLANSLIEFLKQGIEQARKEEWLETRLFLTFLLTQVIAYLPPDGNQDVINLAQKGLRDAIEQLHKDKLSPQQRNIRDHWLVALYPLVSDMASTDTPVIEGCSAACKRLDQTYYPYDFNGRLIIRENFKKGMEKLSGGQSSSKSELPRWVFDHPLYNVVNDKEPKVSFIKEGEFEIVTKQNETYVIKLVGEQDIKILKKFQDIQGKDQLFVHFPIDSSEKHHLLTKNASCWVNETTQEILYVSKKDGSLNCRILKDIIMHPTNPQLVLAELDAQAPIVKRFLALENHSSIIAWKDKTTNKIAKIELSQHKISFERHVDSDGQVKWRCPEQRNMEVDFTSTLPELNPCSHYLVLKKGNEKYALITNRVVLPQKLSFTQTTQIKVGISEDPKSFLYPVTEKGRLELPHDPERLLYLIHVSLRNHKYVETRKLLKQLDNLHATWSSKEKAMVGPLWLELITDSAQDPVSLHKEQDMHPSACALRVRLRLIAARSGPAEKIFPFSLRALAEDYSSCLIHINTLGDAWLSPADELKAIELILSISSKEVLLARQKMLQDELAGLPIAESSSTPSFTATPTPYKPYTSHLKASDLDLVRNFAWVTPDIRQKMLECYEKPMEIGLQLRPGNNFISNFLYYYKIAYDKKPEEAFRALMELLRLSRNGMDPRVECLRRILLNVILSKNNRRPSPHPDKLLESIKEEPQSKEKRNSTSFERICNLLTNFDDKLLKELNWGLAHKFGTPLDLKGLRPKESVILLKASSVPTIPQKVTLKKEAERDDQQILLNEGMIVAQDSQAQKLAIKAEIDDLTKILDKAYHDSDIQKMGPKKMQSRVVEGLEEQLTALKKKLEHPPATYTLPVLTAAGEPSTHDQAVKKLKATEQWLEDRINRSIPGTSELETQVMRLANTRSPKLQREVDAGLIEPLSLEQLMLYFAQEKEDLILKSNPELAGKQFEELKNLLKSYLISKTNLQHLMRSQSGLAKAIQTASREKNGWTAQISQNAANAFVSTLLQKRAYDPVKDFRLLIFEAMSDIRLREDQCEALEKLTGVKEGCDYELEARTGFGKTKVIVALWLLLNNKPGQILTFTTTSSLLNDQIVYLRKTLGAAFDMAFQVIDFNKEKADDLGYLYWLDNEIINAKKDGRILLQSIGTLHGITGLALKQRLFNRVSGTIGLHAELLLLLRQHYEKAVNFIDESAQCFNVRQSYDYASGKPMAVEIEYCQEASNFYQEVVLSPSILSEWNFEFLSRAEAAKNPSAQIPTQDNYDRALRLSLVEAALKYLKVPKEYENVVRNHFLGKDPKKAMEYFSSLNPEQQKRYAYCHDQISNHLKKALLKPCGARYDCGKDRLAVPLEDGSPKLNNEFSTVDILTDFTIQANLKRDIDPDTVKNYAAILKEDFLKQSTTALKHNLSYQLFLQLKKYLPLSSIQELNQEDFEKIAFYLNAPENMKKRLDFIACHILPQIRTLPHKISGNPFTVLRALGIVHAASGTVNPDTLPPRMKTLQKKSALTGNLLAIWKNSEHEILTIPTTDPRAFLKQLLAQRLNDRVLVDVGGIFRDLSQKEIIDSIFDLTKTAHPPINGITFYDNERRCMIWERNATEPIPREESKLSAEEIFVYIRQGHAVGSDTPMSDSAQGTVTFSKETQESFLLQGFGRMRGLTTGQIANFVITEEDARVIREQLNLPPQTKIQLSHLLRCAQKLEIQQKQKDYYFALQLYLKELIESKLWQGLRKRVIKPREFSSCLHMMKELLTESTGKSSFVGLFSELQMASPDEAVARLKEESLKPLKKLLSKHDLLTKIIRVDEIESEFDQFVDIQKLAKFIPVGEAETQETISETESERTEETTQESEATTEIETEQSLSASADFQPAAPVSWNGDYQAQMSSSNTQEKILGILVAQSPNFPRIEQDKSSENRFRKPAYQYVLKIDSKGDASLLALDLHDTSVVLKKMRTTKPGKDRFYMLSNNQIIGSEGTKQGPVALEEIIKDQTTRSKVAVITRILSGGTAFSKQEYEWLEQELGKLSKTERASLGHLLKNTACAWPTQNKLMPQTMMSAIAA